MTSTRDVLSVLFKHSGIIVLFVAAALAVVFAGNFIISPAFESVAKVRLIPGRGVMQTESMLSRNAGILAPALSQEDVNSEVALISSSIVLARVVTELELTKPTEAEVGLLRRMFRGVMRAAREVLYILKLRERPTAEQAAASLLEKALVVEPVKGAHVVEVKVRMSTPELAQRVLAKVLDVYVEEHLKLFANPRMAAFCAEQMARVGAEFKAAQAKREQFLNEHGIVSIDEEKRLLVRQLADLQCLTIQREDAEMALESIGSATTEKAIIEMLSRETESTVVQELQLRLLDLVLQRNRLTKELGPKHPEIVLANREIDGTVTRLKEALVPAKRITEKRIAQSEKRLVELNQQGLRLEDQEREVRILSEAYEYYAEKVEESHVLDAMTSAQMSSVQVISLPRRPVDPIKPKKLLNLALGLVAGVIGGLGLAFLLEYLNHGLRTPEDVELHLRLPVVASFFRDRSEELDPSEVERLSALVTTQRSDDAQSIVPMCSSVPDEGADRVARALAKHYARDSKAKVLLINCAKVGNGGEVGSVSLMDLLLGRASFDSEPAGAGNLHCVSWRSGVEYSPGAYSSERVKALFSDLQTQFDHIVINFDPVLQSHEFLSVAAWCGGMLLVVRAESTRREVVQRAVGVLRELRHHVLGVVLTERSRFIPNAVYRRI